MKKSILLTFALVATLCSTAQIKFTTADFKQAITTIKGLPICDTNAIGITIPLDDKINKYDKVEISLLVRAKGSDDPFLQKEVSNFSTLQYYPKSKKFIDYFDGSTKIEFYLKKPLGSDASALFSNPALCYDAETADIYMSYEYKVVVRGLEKSGTETYWSDYSESIKTRDILKFAKNIYTSDVFYFAIGPDDQTFIDKRELLIKQYNDRMARADEIKEMYSIQVNTPVGVATPRIDVYNAYLILRAKLYETEDYDRLDKVDAKMLSIKKKYLKLGIKLNSIKDPDAIYEEIMNFPY